MLFLLILLFCSLSINVVLIIKSLQLSAQLIEVEDIVTKHNDYLLSVKKILDTNYVEFNKISKYPVTSTDPIVQSMVKLVNNSKYNFELLIDQIEPEENNNVN